MRAGLSPSKRSTPSTWARMRSTQPETTSSAFRTRSSDLPDGSPTSPVAPPTHRDHAVTRVLEAAQRHELEEVAELERRRGGVEAAVERHRPGAICCPQRIEVGRMRDHSPPGEVVEQVGSAGRIHGPMSIRPRHRPLGARPARLGGRPCYPSAPMARRPPPRSRPPARGPVGRGPVAPARRVARRGIAGLPAILMGLCAFAAIGLFVGAMSVYASYTRDLPDVSKLESFASGAGLDRGVGRRRRPRDVRGRGSASTIPFDQIPEVMRNAQVAAEDRFFWTNPCVDFRAIVRAFVQNLSSGPTGLRRVDDLPAARAGAPVRREPDGRPEARGRAEDQGGDPGASRLGRLPGRGRQEADPRHVPQPVLLRQQRLRRLGRRARLFRQGHHEGATRRTG